MVKSILKVSYEMQALRKVQSLPSPRNITVPGRLYECADTYIFVMPDLVRLENFIETPDVSWMRLLDYFDKIIDHVELLHENNSAYVDVSNKNLVWASDDFKRGGFDVPAGALFFINVGSTRVLSSGPGTSVRIHDFKFYGGVYMPPEGLDVVEPYAYDIFAIAETFAYFTRFLERKKPNIYVPRCWNDWCGTMKDPIPENRPSISQVHRQFSSIKAWMSRTAWMYKIFGVGFADAVGSLGWRLISIFVR